MFCLHDYFFDIVFDLVIDIYTYNKENGEYKNKLGKNIIQGLFIFVNGFIFLCCIYVFIFILLPVICFRIGKCSSKNTRITEFKERMGTTTVSLLKDRFTGEN